MPRRSGLVSRVLEVRDDVLVLAAPTVDGEAHVPTTGTPVEVGWMTPNGIAWASSVATGPVQGPRVAFGVRLLQAAVPVQRRRHPRVRVGLALEVVRAAGGDTIQGRVADVSSAGVRATLPVELEAAELVQLTIRHADEILIRASARVARVYDDGSYGLRFELFSAGSAKRLLDLVFMSAAQPR
jgi:c-di-GMP-binding flagellar brake protein YcgR